MLQKSCYTFRLGNLCSFSDLLQLETAPSRRRCRCPSRCLNRFRGSTASTRSMPTPCSRNIDYLTQTLTM